MNGDCNQSGNEYRSKKNHKTVNQNHHKGNKAEDPAMGPRAEAPAPDAPVGDMPIEPEQNGGDPTITPPGEPQQ